MKRLILLTLAVIACFPVLAQNTGSFFKELTDKYADEEGFSASMITKDMFDLYLKKKNIDSESSAFEAIKNLDKILVVSQGNLSSVYATISTDGKPEKKEKSPLPDELYQTILGHYKNGDYTLLKTENRMGEEVKVYLKKNQEKISSLAVLTNSKVNTSLIELQGDIDLSAVADLNKTLNLRGLENLYKINNNNNTTFFGQNSHFYFPQEKIDAIVEQQKELAERQKIFSEKQREKIEEQARFQAEKQMEMAERYREMAERYQRQPIFLNYPGDSTIYYLNGKKVDIQTIKDLNKKDIKSIEVTNDKEDNKTIIKIKAR